MASCSACGEEYSDRRLELGFTTCNLCGDLLAKEEALQMRKRVGPIWNKGPDMYLGSPEDVRIILKTAGGRKNVPLDHNSARVSRGSRTNSSCVASIPVHLGPEAPSNRVREDGHRVNKEVRARPEKKQWVFDHWEFPVDPKTGIRYKRAILKPRGDN